MATVPPAAAQNHPVSLLQAFMADYYGKLRRPAVLHTWMSKRLTGPFDRDLLAEAILELRERHPNLDTRFVNRGSELYARTNGTSPPAVSYRDFSSGSDIEKRDALDEFANSLISERFDISRGPLLRFGLSKLGPADNVLTAVMHHTIGDARSLVVLFRDLFAFYRAKVEGSQAQLPKLQTSLFQEVERQNAWVEGKTGQSRLSFWKKLLDQSRDPFWLPAAHPDLTSPPPADVSTEFLSVDGELRRIRALAREQQCTVSIVLYAAVALALSKWTGRSLVHLKVIHSGRFSPELDDLIGCFAAASILKVDLQAASNLEQSIAPVRDAYANSMPHMKYPFVKLRDFLQERSSEAPLLDITVNHLGPVGPAPQSSARHAGPARPQQPTSNRDAAATKFPLQMGDFGAGPPINLTLDPLSGMKLRVMFTENHTALVCRASHAEEVLDKVSVGLFCRDIRRSLESAVGSADGNV